jgi:hypothetical protein
VFRCSSGFATPLDVVRQKPAGRWNWVRSWLLSAPEWARWESGVGTRKGRPVVRRFLSRWTETNEREARTLDNRRPRVDHQAAKEKALKAD